MSEIVTPDPNLVCPGCKRILAEHSLETNLWTNTPVYVCPRPKRTRKPRPTTMDSAQRERLEGMAAGNPTWDLSPNDCAAIAAALAALDKAEAERDALKRERPLPESIAALCVSDQVKALLHQILDEVTSEAAVQRARAERAEAARDEMRMGSKWAYDAITRAEKLEAENLRLREALVAIRAGPPKGGLSWEGHAKTLVSIALSPTQPAPEGEKRGKVTLKTPLVEPDVYPEPEEDPPQHTCDRSLYDPPSRERDCPACREESP